jgi:hypothetical protein
MEKPGLSNYTLGGLNSQLEMLMSTRKEFKV